MPPHPLSTTSESATNPNTMPTLTWSRRPGANQAGRLRAKAGQGQPAGHPGHLNSGRFRSAAGTGRGSPTPDHEAIRRCLGPAP